MVYASALSLEELVFEANASTPLQRPAQLAVDQERNTLGGLGPVGNVAAAARQLMWHHHRLPALPAGRKRSDSFSVPQTVVASMRSSFGLPPAPNNEMNSPVTSAPTRISQLPVEALAMSPKNVPTGTVGTSTHGDAVSPFLSCEERSKFRTSVSAWYCLTYPLQALQTRSSCEKFMSRSAPVVLDCPVSGDSATSSEKATYDKNVIPPFLGGIFFGLFKTMYKEQGVLGLYRGFAPSLAHILLRDSARWVFLRFISRPLQHITLRGIALLPHCEPHTPSVAEATPQEQQENSRRRLLDSSRDDKAESPSSKENNPRPGDCDYWRLRWGNPRRERWVEVLLLLCDAAAPEIAARLLSEVVAYPLLTVATRVVVSGGLFGYEGLHDVVKTTRSFDGWRGFFAGMTPYLLTRFAEHTLDALSQIVWATSTATPSWTEAAMLNACSSAFVGILCSPISFLSVVQRCQTAAPGLCSPSFSTSEILLSQPWKMFGLQLAVCSALIFLNLRGAK